MKTLALLPLLLVACSGAPFTVAEGIAMQDAPPDAPATVFPIVLPDAEPDADAGSPTVDAMAEASPVVPEASPVSFEAGTLCCHIPGPMPASGGPGPLTYYPCSAGWDYYGNVELDGGRVEAVEFNCADAPLHPGDAMVGSTCYWPKGSPQDVANGGDVGAVLACPQQ
jgi:hypothetical protein